MSGITLTERDPSEIVTPDPGKDTIFMDASVSPPAPAYKDSADNVMSLMGPTGPTGPAGPSGSITVNPNGALDGDGGGGSPLGVLVDNVTIGINASNELEALGAPSSTVSVAPNAALDGDGSIGDPLAVLFDNETIGVDSNNKLQVIASYIVAAAIRRGLTYAGGYLDVNVDNETIGIDSTDKLQVLQRYVVADGNLSNNGVVVGQGGTHAKTVEASALDYPGKLLAVTSYNPAVLTDTSINSTTGIDVDSANLTITFTVPASGNVLVRLTATVFSGSSGIAMLFVLRTTGGANVAGTKMRVTPASTTTGLQMPVSPVYRITGLTPGASQTYRWGAMMNAAGTGHLRYGDDGSATGDEYGPATMEVWTAP